MVFIRIDSNNKVIFQHNMPFDTINGMGMNAEKLEQEGILVDSIPKPVIPDGQQVEGLYINQQTKELHYEYADIPKTDANKIVELQAQNAQMLSALVMGGLM